MSDSSDDDENLPSAQECETRCQKFAEVTGTDTALAMFYLQDRDWNVERAVQAFFESNEGSPADEESPPKKLKLEDTKESTCEEDDPEPHRIRLMSWNIDGLDENSVVKRTKSVCSIINKELPHIVFLQEVTPLTQEILQEKCSQYKVLVGGRFDYFTAMLLLNRYVELEHKTVINFDNSLMLRNLLIAQCKVKGVKLGIMTTHLESTKEHAKTRIAQLKDAFSKVQLAAADRTIIFGGDLNLRDQELTSIGGPPPGIKDIWETSGQRPEAAFTWDMSRNDNLKFPGKFKPKLRFDRLFIRHPKTGDPVVDPVYFELIGLERIPQCGRFPSDHWGLLTHYNILSKVHRAASKVYK